MTDNVEAPLLLNIAFAWNIHHNIIVHVIESFSLRLCRDPPRAMRASNHVVYA